MKRLAILCLVMVLIATVFCGCARTSGAVDAEPNEEGIIGYVIIHHSDGDERADITDYSYSGGGTLKAYCADGRTIISNRITLILE